MYPAVCDRCWNKHGTPLTLNFLPLPLFALSIFIENLPEAGDPSFQSYMSPAAGRGPGTHGCQDVLLILMSSALGPWVFVSPVPGLLFLTSLLSVSHSIWEGAHCTRSLFKVKIMGQTDPFQILNRNCH